MLKTLASMVARFRLFSLVLLAAAFVAPAYEGHACAAEGLGAAVVFAAASASPASDDGCAGCPDCGPACASGCCHAPHSGVTPSLMNHRFADVFAAPAAWRHVTRAPMHSPPGPDHPPRL